MNGCFVECLINWFVILNLQFFTDTEIIVESVIIDIHQAHSPVGRWHFQGVEQMPFGTAKIV